MRCIYDSIIILNNFNNQCVYKINVKEAYSVAKNMIYLNLGNNSITLRYEYPIPMSISHPSPV